MKTIVRILAVCAAIVAPTTARAAQYSCLDYVVVSSGRGASIMVSSYAGSTYVYLCSMASTANGVTAEECKRVYATLLAAQLAGKRVRMWFDDALTCSTQPYWAFATGWYWGPEVLD